MKEKFLAQYFELCKTLKSNFWNTNKYTWDLKVDACQSNLHVMLNQLLFFYKFYDFFCRRHSLMNRPCYNNLFQIMQHEKLRNLNRAIFTNWKHLESRVNVIWYWFSVIKRYTFHCFMKSAPIPGNQGSIEILQLFDTWCCQSYQSDIIFYFYYDFKLRWIRWYFSCIAEQSSFRRDVT